MVLYYTIVFFIFGTILASFYNVVGSRLPNGESIVHPPSHCTNCNHQLGPLELIPILSFLIQGGKCKSCKQKISWFHPLYELVTGIIFALTYRIFGFSPELVIGLTFISVLLILIVSDYYYMIIPDEVLFVGAILLAIEIFFGLGFRSFLYSVINGILSFAIMYCLKIFGDFLFKKESMGGGDIKLLFLFGMVLGVPISIISIFLAAFIGLPFSLMVYFFRKTNVVPFGPFLSVAAIIIYLSRFDLSVLSTILMGY